MKPAFLLFFDNFSSTYFLLFCFYSTIYINSYNVVIKDIYDFIPTISKSLITIKENNTFYITNNTVISNFEIKNSIKRDKKNNSMVITSIYKSYYLSDQTKNKIFYIPYEKSTIFITNKLLLAPYPMNFFNIIIFYSNYFYKNYNSKTKLKLFTYDYIFCHYSRCLYHLEIRSPSMMII